MTTKPSPTFAVGDRVALIDQGPFYAMNRGIVVLNRGKHYPKSPRVRWDSGWGLTSKADELRHLSPEECAQHPAPTLCHLDRP